MYTETQRHRVFFDYDNDDDYDFFPLFFVFRLSSPRSLQAPPPSSPPFEGGGGVVKQLHWARDG